VSESVEGLIYYVALRRREQQGDALKDARTRAGPGLLLAADFTAFLGRRAFSNTSSGVVPWLALIAFLLAAGDSDRSGDRPPEGAPP
jgi:hypothetical protein